MVSTLTLIISPDPVRPCQIRKFFRSFLWLRLTSLIQNCSPWPINHLSISDPVTPALGFRDNGEQKCKLQNSQLLFFLLRHKPRNQFNFTLYTHTISPISLLRSFIFTLALEPVLLIPHTSHSIRIVQNSVSNIFSIVWGQSWHSSLG